MIRPPEQRDHPAVIAIVNESWKTTYAGYVDPALLDGPGCAARGRGIGGGLPAFAESCTRAVIWAFRENVRAGAFCQSRGYRPDREEYLGEPCRAWGIRRLKQLDREGEEKR